MAEELKHLIDQIQKEGVEKANEQANTILSDAKDKAARIIEEASKKAADSIAKAQTESDAFAARSVKTLEQASRDLLITAGQGCERVITNILNTQVDTALDSTLLEKMILNVVAHDTSSSVEINVSKEDQTALVAFCTNLAKKSGQQIELNADSEVLSGFKLGFKGESVYLDFTGEAIAGALSAFLRPELAEIVTNAAREQLPKA